MKKRDNIKKKIKENHDRKLFLRKIRFREKKRNRNRSFLGVSREVRKQKSIRNYDLNYFNDFKIIEAPRCFSLLENTNEVLDFISKIKKCFESRKKVFIRMSNTTTISNDAIVVLLSNLIQFKANRIDFNGDFPRDSEAKKILKESGFLEYLYKDDIQNEDTYTFEKTIYTHANKNVNAQLANEIIEDASEKLWRERRRCQGLYRVFIELMQNTNNHASNHGKGEKLWWLSTIHNEVEKKVCFSFIDYGVGILDSLQSKKNGKFAKIIDTIKAKFNPSNNAEILKLLLLGKIHELVKEQAYNRGKGLPGIYKSLKNNNISNLMIITNNVYADMAKDSYITMKGSLSGTFVYWELNENNNSLK